MNWKQTIYTALITLLATVISGLIVNWYTTNKINKRNDGEKLQYQISRVTNFSSDSLKLSFYVLDLENQGKEKAENIRVMIKFNTKIVGANGLLIRTNETLKKTINDDTLKYSIPNLYQGDKFHINLVSSLSAKLPTINIESSKTIAQPSQQDSKNTPNEDKLDFGLGVLLIAVSLLIPTLYLSKRFLIFYKVGLNNTGFLFAHNNQIDLAGELLTKEIERDGGDAYLLSNLALVKRLQNKPSEEYNGLIDMANFLSKTRKADFVITFNKFAIASLNKDYLNAKALLSRAAKLNKSELIRYLNLSKIFSNIRVQDAQIDHMINDEL